MDVTKLPFNNFIEMENGNEAEGYLTSLPSGEKYTNHLGTVHASALFAVAEACSGAFLLKNIGTADGFIPVVRHADLKYKKPARGRISAKANMAANEIERIKNELSAKGRTLATVAVDVIDEAGTLALTAAFEWFIAKEK